MRLRGYGDGIVAEQAAAFVRAYMDVRKPAILERRILAIEDGTPMGQEAIYED